MWQPRRVFIGHVDAGLEKLLRARLPLSEEIGDVSFERPSSTWSAQLSRLTVSLYLYDVQRSSQPSRAQVARAAPADGSGAVRRRPQPMVELGYLVSAWAGSARDEHLLLGEVVSVLAGVDTIPPDLSSPELSSSVMLTLGDDRSTGRELWTGIGGNLKPALCLRATVAADTFDWETTAPSVTRLSVLAERMEEGEQGASTSPRLLAR